MFSNVVFAVEHESKVKFEGQPNKCKDLVILLRDD